MFQISCLCICTLLFIFQNLIIISDSILKHIHLDWSRKCCFINLFSSFPVEQAIELRPSHNQRQMLSACLVSRWSSDAFKFSKANWHFILKRLFFNHKKGKMKVITIMLKFLNLKIFPIFIWYNYFPQANKNQEL